MRDKIILEKILKYINKLIAYTDKESYGSFVDNSVLVEACVFNLSQIGELANKIDKEFKEGHKTVPWRTMYGLRNKIVHDYEGVNLLLVWEIVKDDLPDLKETLENILLSL